MLSFADGSLGERTSKWYRYITCSERKKLYTGTVSRKWIFKIDNFPIHLRFRNIGGEKESFVCGQESKVNLQLVNLQHENDEFLGKLFRQKHPRILGITEIRVRNLKMQFVRQKL